MVAVASPPLARALVKQSRATKPAAASIPEYFTFSTAPMSDLHLGVIGIDSSHLPAFTERIHDLHDAGETRCRVTHLWTDGDHDMPAAEVEKWRQQAFEMGVEEAGDLHAMLDRVDGVMVLSVNGNKHFPHALPALERGLPTYIDKPLTCDLGQARKLLAASRKSKARCYSASSLRFITELETIPREQLGNLVAVEATGPGELNESMAGLFFYGVHTIEMIDAIWGPGMKRVSAVRNEPRDLIRLEYHDGRFASLRLERKGSYTFAASVHGEKGYHAFEVDFAPVYGRLVRRMVDFFEGGKAPVELRDIVENVATMEAGNLSIERQGAWVDVEAIE